MSELDDVFRNDCRTCGALRGEWCAEWCPSNMDYEPAHELAGALVALGHAIARFVRRSEVEDLRLTVRNAWRVGMDICKPPSPEDKRRAVVALDRLAAIASEGR